VSFQLFSELNGVSHGMQILRASTFEVVISVFVQQRDGQTDRQTDRQTHTHTHTHETHGQLPLKTIPAIPLWLPCTWEF